MYDLWLGGYYGASMEELIFEVGLDFEPHEWMHLDLVLTGTDYRWPKLQVS